MKEQVIELLQQGLNLNEIQETLSLSNRQFSTILKQIRNSGYNFTKSYFSDGQIIVKFNKTLNFGPENNTIRINVKDRVLRAIFISDLHIGSIYDRPEILSKLVFGYMEKHDIHVLFNGGDFIENVYDDRKDILRNKSVKEQIRRALHIYPAVKNITSFNLYGNHDYKCITDNGFDIARYLEDKRYDLVSLGYGTAIIKMKDDAIAITHQLSKSKNATIPENVTMTFKGHSHKSKNRENKLIYIPSLSEAESVSYEYRPLMGFLDVEFIFFDKVISKINIKHLAIVNDEIRLANEESITVKPEIEERRTESRMAKKYKPNKSKKH